MHHLDQGCICFWSGQAFIHGTLWSALLKVRSSTAQWEPSPPPIGLLCESTLAAEQWNRSSTPETRAPTRLISPYVASPPFIMIAVRLHVSAMPIISAYNYLLRKAHIHQHRKIVMDMLKFYILRVPTQSQGKCKFVSFCYRT